MKNCLIAIALFAAAAVVSAVETAAMQYAPDSSVVAAEINVEKMLQIPAVQALLNQPEYAARRQKYEARSGVRVTDLKAAAFFVEPDGSRIALLNVAKPVDFESVFKNAQLPYRKFAVNGKTVFRLNGSSQDETGELAALGGGWVVCGEKGAVIRYLKSKRGNAAALAGAVKKVPAGSSFWTAFVNPMKSVDGTVEDPQQMYMILDFAGKTQRDVTCSMRFFCGSTEGAQMFLTRLPMFVMMGSALLFSQDPELGSKLTKCIKSTFEKAEVLLQAYFPEELCKQAADYIEQNSEQFLLMKSPRKSVKRRKKRAVQD